ncbi:MAG: hypothetical protein HOP13_14315 [Alphaproteobacteria bacterium]|nr:hypothetical protein [Alphaproteobacteria bacterium]
MSYAVTDTDKINRIGWGLAAFAAVSGAAVLAGAPWLFPKLLPATGTAFAYDPNFVPAGGAAVVGLWGLSALLYAAVFAEGQWRPFTRQLEAALSLVWVVALTWLVSGPQIFASATTDQTAKFWIGFVLVAMVLSMIPKVRR